MTDEPRAPWDRRLRETARAYDAFRAFRDLGPLRSLDAVVTVDRARHTVVAWSTKHDWRDRAEAWDDELHRTADAARLEEIRAMHELHVRAGRAVFAKALRALDAVKADEIPPYVAGRLLELGARLERDTLTVSVEELQGIETAPLDDPWEIVARELDRADDRSG